LPGIGRGAIGLVAIIKGDQLDLAPVDPPLAVDLVEIELGTKPHFDAQFLGRAGQWNGLADHDAVVAHARFRVGESCRGERSGSEQAAESRSPDHRYSPSADG